MVAATRVMGKRQLGELEPAEFVVAVLISDLAANPLADPGTPLLYGVVPVVTLLFCETMISFVMLKSMRLRQIVAGRPSVIIDEGRLNAREMRRNRYTLDELNEHLRKSGIHDISTVRHAVLETDGTLSALIYAAESPLTPKQANTPVEDPELPTPVISDGAVLLENLKRLGFNLTWLDRRLREQGCSDPTEIFYMTCDKTGKLYLAPQCEI
jgi:uncharacterized membrane protein YcaP (DUF421 family)